MAKAHKKSLPAIVISLAAILLTLGLNGAGLFQPLENIAYDWRLKSIRSDVSAPEDVAVVLIDEPSLQSMSGLVGRWPWPRSVHADAIDFINQGGPKAIIFDILFTEPQGTREDAEAQQSDQRLIDSTAEAANVIHSLQITHELEAENTNINRAMPPSLTKHAVTYSASTLLGGNHFFGPLPGLDEASLGVGVVTAEADKDGVYRATPLKHQYQDKHFASLGVAPLYFTNTPVDWEKIDSEKFLINYYGKVTNYSMAGILLSAQRLLDGDLDNLVVDPYEFENKIVFIGASAVGLEDIKTSPLSNTMPGVMIHASVVGNLLSGDILVQIPAYVTVLLVILFSLATTLIVLFWRQLILKIISPVLLILIYTGIGYQLFAYNLVAELVPPLAAIVIASSICSGYLQFTEGRDKRRVRNMLAQYVSPAVLNSVVDKYEDYIQAEVGSEEELSILFSDIRGFTSLSEAVPAAKVVEMLNHYFSAMNEAIFEKRGTIDKFIGDAIMAFWGAPIYEENHADLALQAAIDMHYRLKVVNEWLTDKGYPNIQIGIGINSGPVILGNIGSVQKLDYTVIGDNVNLASRLEGLTKPYGCAIVISEFTQAKLKEKVPCHTLDLVKVKGKNVPIRIYGIVLDHDEQESVKLAQIGEDAFNAYLNRDWDKAITLYKQLGNSALEERFTERCEAYRENPPAQDWDGAFTMTTK